VFEGQVERARQRRQRLITFEEHQHRIGHAVDSYW
jgi:hypothetical protein